MIDRDILISKLNELEKYISELEGFETFTLEEIYKSTQKAWAIEHGLQLSIQLLVDIGSHILAAIGETKINDYTDIIDKLGERRIIPSLFAKSIRNMAGFRNILVHEYIDVDLEQVYDVLRNKLGDFKKFNSYIRKYLKI